jgi:hypothetical protein
MRGFEAYWCDDSGFECPFPWFNTNAPAIAGFEAGKAIFRAGSDEIVPDGCLMTKELFVDDHTNRVTADIFRTRVTLTIAVKTCQRISATSLQNSAKNVLHHIEPDYLTPPGIYFWALWAKPI